MSRRVEGQVALLNDQRRSAGQSVSRIAKERGIQLVRFTLAYPIGDPGADTEFGQPDTLIRVVQQAERSGFAALAMTDHPAPSRKWLDAGGHAGFDPLAALAFCAAATSRIRLMTYLLVLPYRNPLLAARSIATTDRLSSGRLDLVVGSGYLRSEFAALGVDFDKRGELLDQAIDVLRQVFTTTQLRYEGSSFTALGVTMEPGPIQLPHPPIWIGGNGARSRERAALVGNGWSPLQVDAAKSLTTRTVKMTSIVEIRSAIEDLYRRVGDAGRERADVPVQLQSSTLAQINVWSVERIREHVSELESVGVRQMVVRVPNANVDGVIAALETFGEEVVLNQR